MKGKRCSGGACTIQRKSRLTGSHTVERTEASTATKGCAKVAGLLCTREQRKARWERKKLGGKCGVWDLFKVLGGSRTMLRPCSRLSHGNMQVCWGGSVITWGRTWGPMWWKGRTIAQVVLWPPPSVMVPERYTSIPRQKGKGRSWWEGSEGKGTCQPSLATWVCSLKHTAGEEDRLP